MSDMNNQSEEKKLVHHARDIVRDGLLYSLGGLAGTLIFSWAIGWRTWAEIGDALQYATLLALILGGLRYILRPAFPRFRKLKPHEMEASLENFPKRRYDREQRILDQNLKQFLTGVVAASVLYIVSKIVYAFLVI